MFWEFLMKQDIKLSSIADNHNYLTLEAKVIHFNVLFYAVYNITE